MNKGTTVAIAKLKIDDKGRITLPKFFLEANGLKEKQWVTLLPVYNNNSQVKLDFEEEKTNE